MSLPSPLWLEQGDGRRRAIEARDFPVIIGGPSADIDLADNGDRAAAFIGIEADDMFVQPGDAGASVTCNGAPLTASHWLRDGDVVRVGATQITLELKSSFARFHVEVSAFDDVTEPPELVSRAAPPPPPRGPVSIAPTPFTPHPIRKIPVERPPARRERWLYALLGSMPLAAIWFLITATAIEIRVEPEPDRLSLEGSLPGLRFLDRRLVRPGTYTVVAEKSGYQVLSAQIEVSSDTGQSFSFRLSKLPGMLTIDTGDVSGARVLIDGEEAGVTPLPPFAVAAGEHIVRFEAERYAPLERTIAIEGAGTAQTLAVELEPRWAAVTISSTPDGATVRIDAESVGRTPLTIDVGEGAHRVEWLLRGYKPRARNIVVVPQQPLVVPNARLIASDGNLVVASEPDGATVQVDGEFRGRTPLDLDLAADREHRLRFTKTGYEPLSQLVELRSGQQRTLSVELKEQFGELEVRVQPPDAALLINGTARGRADQVVRLAAREQQIEIRKEGFEPHRVSLSIRPDFRQSLRVTLKTLEQARVEKRPRAIRTQEGHELGLVEGGKLRMGASRREPGRRANETLRDVELTRPFYVGTQEVSNRQFRRFDRQHLSGAVEGQSLETDHHPVVRVTWAEAAAYCNWLSKKESLPAAYVTRGGKLGGATPMTKGFRLPTEAEWAFVARFEAGDEKPRKYPWGPALPVAAGSGNYADLSAQIVLPGIIRDYKDDYVTTAPVDAFQPNGFGLFNMGGNVAEWVHDFYSIPAARGKVARDPPGPNEGEHHVIRGSSWMDSTVTELRLSYRDYGDTARPDLGFRIARYAE